MREYKDHSITKSSRTIFGLEKPQSPCDMCDSQWSIHATHLFLLQIKNPNVELAQYLPVLCQALRMLSNRITSSYYAFNAIDWHSEQLLCSLFGAVAKTLASCTSLVCSTLSSAATSALATLRDVAPPFKPLP